MRFCLMGLGFGGLLRAATLVQYGFDSRNLTPHCFDLTWLLELTKFFLKPKLERTFAKFAFPCDKLFSARFSDFFDLHTVGRTS